MRKPLALTLWVAAALLPGVPAVAADSTRAGDVTIYHSAFAAATLTPEIARSVGIQRSPHLGVLNVSVRRDRAGETPASVKALVEVELREGERRLGPVAMREVEAAGAVSYLGQFPIRDGQDLLFEIRVRPAGETTATTLNLRQEFYTQ